MKINTSYTLEQLNAYCSETMSDWLGIEFTEITADYLVARMPVDRRTHQPLKMLNGGASLALAEITGSMAANLVLDREKYVALGLDINANHLRPVMQGFVFAKASPLHVGKKTQVWEIRISNESGELVCISRFTLAVVERNGLG